MFIVLQNENYPAMARPGCKLVTRFSYDPSRHVYHVSGRSQTVPDMNYSIRTLLDRYQRNPVPIGLASYYVYDEEIDTDVISKTYQDEEYETIYASGHAPDLTDISDARDELRAIKKSEKSKRVARDRERQRKENQKSRIEASQSQQSLTNGGNGEQV